MAKKNKKATVSEVQDKPYLLFWFLLVVIGMWLLSWAFLMTYYNLPDNAGEFGDMFGTVNSLFSGLTFAGIGYSIVLQRREIRMQRDQIALNHKEFKKQNKNLKRQRFENTFFQLVSLHHQIVNNLKYEEELTNNPKIIHEGRDVFFKFKQDCKQFYLQLKDEVNANSIDNNDDLEMLIKAIRKIYQENYQDSLSHYYRNLYHIYRFIYTSDLIVAEDKQMYANILSSQLTTNELAMLLYHVILPGIGYPKFYYLFRRFNLMKYIELGALFDIKHLELALQLNDENPFMRHS
ncbi:MAG: putative phage abortive infection protein [Cytophagales bacterium]|nr:putative phage abortive infection protein [Cytophagales bacterium]MDW8385337.1 putative phage abortive infection protein [Flammeovirgaceae bacterium]